MKSVLKATLTIASLTLYPGCVEEGSSADCAEGTTEELEAAGCFTPIGGSCLTFNEFKEGRPESREVTEGEEVVVFTVQADWVSYMDARTECCFAEEDFKTGRPATREEASKTITLEEDWAAHELECASSNAE